MVTTAIDIVEHHAWLCEEIRVHDYAYYVLCNSAISDEDYDALWLELKQLEEDHPHLVTSGSPTQRVGSSLPGGTKKHAHLDRHVEPMLSLNNIYTRDEIYNWFPQDQVVVLEPKLDGASIAVQYRHGQLVQALTRGDGETGEDVTAAVRTIRGLPLQVADLDVDLRGEVVIHKDDFERINVDREQKFANPRNAAAGALRLNDPEEVRSRHLRVYFYDALQQSGSHRALLEALDSLRLPTHRQEMSARSPEELWNRIQYFESSRHALPYETDGVVLKVDDIEARRAMGFTARAPRGAVAFKFAAQRAETLLMGITIDVGRTGVLTPVAVLHPVRLSGSVVSKASLHNPDYIAEKDIRILDTVEIEKAGEIIPQVVRVVPKDGERSPAWVMPESCPSCGSATAQTDAALRCTNTAGWCGGRARAQIFWFTRRGCMDIEHCGEAVIDVLVGSSVISNAAGLYTLERDSLLRLPRFGELTVDRLLESIEKSKTSRTLAQIITALGIPHVGETTAESVAQHFGTLEGLLDPKALLMLGRVVGPKTAAEITTYLKNPKTHELIRRLLSSGVRELQAPRTGPLLGKSFCVTGTLSVSRDDVHALIRSLGGDVHQSVKKNTTYLVVGAEAGATKLAAAEKRGTTVVDEKQLEEILG